MLPGVVGVSRVAFEIAREIVVSRMPETQSMAQFMDEGLSVIGAGGEIGGDIDLGLHDACIEGRRYGVGTGLRIVEYDLGARRHLVERDTTRIRPDGHGVARGGLSLCVQP